MWYKNVGTCFFHFVTIHAFDRHTDGQTDFSWLDRVANFSGISCIWK